MGSLKNAFGQQQRILADFEVFSTTPIEFSDKESSRELDLLEDPTAGQSPPLDRRLVTAIRDVVRQSDLDDVVEVENEERGVVLRVIGKLLFESGDAALRSESLDFLAQIAAIAERVPNHISIEGHTDDQPIRSARFPSNWHLASARAISTLEFLNERGNVPLVRMSAASYGPTRPLVPNDARSDRETNRRVEFVFVREGGPQGFDPGSPARVLDESGILD